MSILIINRVINVGVAFLLEYQHYMLLSRIGIHKLHKGLVSLNLVLLIHQYRFDTSVSRGLHGVFHLHGR